MAAALAHSTLAVGVGSTLAVCLASATGFALARYRYRGKTITALLVTVTLFLPVSALVIPLFELLQSLGMLSSLFWLGVVYGVLFSAWATIFMRSFFLQLPQEMFEAAQVDGAGTLRTFVSIALPLARPAIATAFILTFFLQWSELPLGAPADAGWEHAHSRSRDRPIHVTVPHRRAFDCSRNDHRHASRTRALRRRPTLASGGGALRRSQGLTVHVPPQQE